MLRIIQSFQRPSKELLEGFRKIPTPTISDAMGRQNTMFHNLKPLFLNIKLVGFALTVRTYPSDNLMCHLGIKLARPGDVIVVSTDGYVDAGYWGEIMTTIAIKRGIRGLVIDGGVRDISAITKLGFPVFCRGIIPKGTFKSHPGCINIPISCGGVSVSPGDIVVGDDDGIAIVPKKIAKLVLKKAKEAGEKEKVMKEKVEHGEIPYDFLNLGKLLDRPDVKWM